VGHPLVRFFAYLSESFMPLGDVAGSAFRAYVAHGVEDQKDEQNGPQEEQGPEDPGKEEEDDGQHPEHNAQKAPGGGAGVLAAHAIDIFSKQGHSNLLYAFSGSQSEASPAQYILP
jgi:hypothetical protein